MDPFIKPQLINDTKKGNMNTSQIKSTLVSMIVSGELCFSQNDSRRVPTSVLSWCHAASGCAPAVVMAEM